MYQPMRTLCLTAALLCVPLHAAAPAGPWPLWDGKETVESYAARVGMPATKSIDLGSGVKLELVLIPAGQFIMGSAEPAKPTLTVANSNWLIGLGGGAATLLLLLLIITCTKKRKFSFSLRWLLLLMIATGLCIGGIARRSLAIKEAARYEREMSEFNARPANEKPAHLVTLTQPFYMGKYLVTQSQYELVIGRNPSDFKGSQLPVETVSWNDATAFCAKLNERLSDKALNVHLPTEAQWEFSCRAGTRTRFNSGDQESDLDSVAWYGANSKGTTHPVGLKKANAFGLYDMHGNVLQWCGDAWVDHYDKEEVTNPIIEQGEDRDLRGCTWSTECDNCRSASRNNIHASFSGRGVGFRIVMSVSEERRAARKGV
ncbi:MAG TPA: formylglycine-generating enzyme family protein [Planctomycetota bacterium]|nr:formylglycine-generating enzyme family protein [Planctomycetota bacterium]